MSNKKDFTNSLKLSENNTLRLLQLYRNEPCLYDIHSKDYRRRESRMDAIKRIVEALNVKGFGPREISMKFKNLRNSYSQELKKIKELERSGADEDEPYVPKIYWFTLLDSFLRPQMYSRPWQSSSNQVSIILVL